MHPCQRGSVTCWQVQDESPSVPRKERVTHSPTWWTASRGPVVQPIVFRPDGRPAPLGKLVPGLPLLLPEVKAAPALRSRGAGYCQLEPLGLNPRPGLCSANCVNTRAVSRLPFVMEQTAPRCCLPSVAWCVPQVLVTTRPGCVTRDTFQPLNRVPSPANGHVNLSGG